MANYRMNKIAIGSNTYEVAEWYGYCATAAGTQEKKVSISGFTSAQLVEGCKVTVRFINNQNYTGAPTLNVSNTGAKTIYVGDNGGNAKNTEWYAGAVLSFVFFNNTWRLENGDHASTTCYGRTKLSNTISSQAGVALTPKAVYDAGYVNSAGAAAAAPVQSVNGQTGAVTLTIPTVPTDVSSFNNDAGYLTLSTLPIWDGSVT